MAFLYQDFVDREEQLRFLHQSVEQLNWRIVLIRGRAGIGKTTLLNEFLAEAHKNQSNVVSIDLSQDFKEQSYLSIILDVQRQLGFSGFERLDRILHEARSFRPPAHELHVPVAADQNQAYMGKDAQSGSSGPRIVFESPVVAPDSQFAGRDIINLYQVILYGDPFEQASIRVNVTQAFLQDLLIICQQRKLVLTLDHWESANHELHAWLWENLLQWTLQQPTPQMVVLVVCQDLPGWYQKRVEIASLELVELPEEAVRLYWIEKQKLPEANLEKNLGLYGYPLLMVMAALETARQSKRSKN